MGTVSGVYGARREGFVRGRTGPGAVLTRILRNARSPAGLRRSPRHDAPPSRGARGDAPVARLPRGQSFLDPRPGPGGEKGGRGGARGGGGGPRRPAGRDRLHLGWDGVGRPRRQRRGPGCSRAGIGAEPRRLLRRRASPPSARRGSPWPRTASSRSRCRSTGRVARRGRTRVRARREDGGRVAHPREQRDGCRERPDAGGGPGSRTRPGPSSTRTPSRPWGRSRSGPRRSGSTCFRSRGTSSADRKGRGGSGRERASASGRSSGAADRNEVAGEGRRTSRPSWGWARP